MPLGIKANSEQRTAKSEKRASPPADSLLVGFWVLGSGFWVSGKRIGAKVIRGGGRGQERVGRMAGKGKIRRYDCKF
jgi:hypothetical protein